jgi:hypothetical protein
MGDNAVMLVGEAGESVKAPVDVKFLGV